MAERISRRDFVRTLPSAAFLVGGFGRHPAWGAPLLGDAVDGWHPLRQLVAIAPRDLTLRAATGTAEVGGGVQAEAWMINDVLPSPLLRVRRGEQVQVTLQNDLVEELILHWHGLTPPDEADGHPRHAVRRGGSYQYSFTVNDRAGTYWYHSHAHRKAAKHTALGIAGMLIVDDPDEEALELPRGEREIPLILQDRQLDTRARPIHSYANVMTGYLGDEPFGNGVRRPYLDCDSAIYRLRILNGANARVFRLVRSDGGPLVLIGTDGGLLDRPRSLFSIDVGPAERVDVLVDLTALNEGDVVTLSSAEFVIRGGLEHLLAQSPQGMPLDLLQLRVTRRVVDDVRIPNTLLDLDLPDPARSVREREFRFGTDQDPVSRMVMHSINGTAYDMERVDVRVPFGETEIWTLKNDDGFAHPVHLHGTHFRVLSRSGNRNEVMAWEAGLKDTVLLYPSETVRIAVRFTAHRGLYLLHCHNLEHEDVGMMLNVLVE